MNFDMRELELQVITKTLQEETGQKQFIISQIEQEYAFRCMLPKQVKGQASFIKYSRQMIGNLEKVYQDLSSFFTDLKIESTYQVFFRIFKIMVMGFKTISELMLSMNQKKQKYVQCDEQNKKNQIKTPKNFSKELKYTQKLDYIIKEIENQEQKILKEKHMLQNNLLFQKKAIQNINPSNAIHEIKELKTILQNIMDHSQTLVHEDYLFRHQELHNFILKLKKPSTIKESILKQLSDDLKQIFTAKIIHLISIIYQHYQKQKQELQRSFQEAKIQKISILTQTKICLNDNLGIQSVEKDSENNTDFANENKNLKEKIKELERKYEESQKKCSMIEEMIKDKNIQIYQLKNDSEWTLQKKNSLIDKLNKKIKDLKKSQIHNSQSVGVNSDRMNMCDKTFQTTFQKTDETLRNAERRKEKKKIQFKLDKKKEEEDINAFMSALNSISSQLQLWIKVENYYCEGIEKIVDFSSKIRQQIQILKNKKAKIESLYLEEKKNKQKKVKNASAQANIQVQKNIQSKQKKQSKEESKTMGKLEKLKKQLIEKLQTQKREKELQKFSSNKFPKEAQTIGFPEKKNQIKQTARYSRKQLTFEELKIQRKPCVKKNETTNRFHFTAHSPYRFNSHEKKEKRQKFTEQTMNSCTLAMDQIHQFENDDCSLVENSPVAQKINKLIEELLSTKNQKNQQELFMYLLQKIGKEHGKGFILNADSAFFKTQ